MRCFLFPHTRFIRYWESLPAYAWKGFLFVRKISQAQEQSGFFVLFLLRRERKIKVLSFRGFKNEGVILYVVKDIWSCRKNRILFLTTGLYFDPLCPKKMEGIHSPLILDNWMTFRTGYDFAMTPKGRAKRRCGETPGQAHKNGVRVKRQLHIW